MAKKPMMKKAMEDKMAKGSKKGMPPWMDKAKAKGKKKK